MITIRRVLTVSLVIVATPVIVYAVWFWRLPPITDPKDLGPFGDYIGGLVNPLLAILNICVVAYIATGIHEANRGRETNEEQVRQLYFLFSSWNSETIYNCRTKGDVVLRKIPGKSLKDLSKHHAADSGPIWVVLGFFQNLQFSISRNLVVERDAIELFGQIFTWWDVVCVKGDYPAEWDTFGRISKLRETVKSVSEANGFPLAEWIKRAEADLDAYKGIRKTPE